MPRKPETNTSAWIAALEQERELLLIRHPELRELQKEYERTMKMAGTDPLRRAELSYRILSDQTDVEFIPAIKQLAELQTTVGLVTKRKRAA